MTRPPARILPGFSLAIAVTALGGTLFVVLPLSAVLLHAGHLSLAQFRVVALEPRARAAYRLSLEAALIAAMLDLPVGLLFAWVTTRYRFPGRWVLEVAIDLPVVLPTAVLGLALSTTYARSLAYSVPGVVLALAVVGLPFVVRTISPWLSVSSGSTEDASASLGATRWQTFHRVTVPMIAPALMTGAALAFARALGEYGSVVFIAGNLPFRTEIAPLLIMTRIEEFDDAGATAIAAVLLILSLGLLLLIHRLQRWTAMRAGMPLSTPF
jgi:sulfate transport system permease protein